MYKLDPNMEPYGKKVLSQNNEDGILEYIFSVIPNSKSYAEIGVGIGSYGLEGNCVLLWQRGWKGVLIDEVSQPGVVAEKINALNINRVLLQNRVPDNLDVFSIDIDGQDFWVWMNLLCQSSVVVIEYNANWAPDESKVIPFDADYRWDGTKYFGASLRALHGLGRSRGYTLVYANRVNSFFVRDYLLENRGEFKFDVVYRHWDIHPPDPLNRPWVTIPKVNQ